MIDVTRSFVSAPRCIDEVVTVLDDLTRALPGNMAAFPIVYGTITRKVQAHVDGPGGSFRMPAVVSRLAGRFCERYLETLSARRLGLAMPSRPWVIAYELVDRVDPLRAAMLGLVAHIHVDLPECIVEVLDELNVRPGLKDFDNFRHDHDAVDGMLHDSFLDALLALQARFGTHSMPLVVSSPWTGLARRASTALLTKWRASAWRTVEQMMHDPAAKRGLLLEASLRGSVWADALTLDVMLKPVTGDVR